MNNEIKTTIEKLIRMRKRVLQMRKSNRPVRSEHEAIRSVEFYLNKNRSNEEWKNYARLQMERIRFIAPTNKSGQSLLSKLNTLIQ